jgi:hypothetical protein
MNRLDQNQNRCEGEKDHGCRLDEAPVKIYQPQESLEISYSRWLRKETDGGDPVRQGWDASCWHMVAQKLHLSRPEDAFRRVDHQAVCLQDAQNGGDVAAMSLQAPAGDEGRPLRMLSMRSWKVIPAFLSPKGIWQNSNNPNGVITAVLGMSAAATGTCRYPLRKSIFEKKTTTL